MSNMFYSSMVPRNQFPNPLDSQMVYTIMMESARDGGIYAVNATGSRLYNEPIVPAGYFVTEVF